MKNNKYGWQGRTLIENTFFLYVVTFSNQLINIITIPYQTRVLGSAIYGKLGVALSVMAYVQIALDFGFILSATAQVANAKDNNVISKIMTLVTIIKLSLSVVVFGIMIVILFVIPEFRMEIRLYILYYIAYLFNGLLPDYVYRGLECMRWISLRTLAIRAFFMVFMLLFVKTPKDYMLIPLFLALGNMVAVFVSYFDLQKKEIKFVKVSKKEIKTEIHETFPFFVSRFSASFYQALNGIILGIYFSGTSIVGCYFAADKLISFSKSCASPIADSIYPYMIKNRNYKLVKKILRVSMPCILLGAAFLFIFAEEFSVLVFGKEYRETAEILRIMLPIMIVILPTYLLAFPVMVPLGIKKYANMSNVFGAIVQICLLSVLFFSKHIEIATLAATSSIAELSVFVFRILAVLIVSRKEKREFV